MEILLVGNPANGVTKPMCNSVGALPVANSHAVIGAARSTPQQGGEAGGGEPRLRRGGGGGLPQQGGEVGEGGRAQNLGGQGQGGVRRRRGRQRVPFRHDAVRQGPGAGAPPANGSNTLMETEAQSSGAWPAAARRTFGGARHPDGGAAPQATRDFFLGDSGYGWS